MRRLTAALLSVFLLAGCGQAVKSGTAAVVQKAQDVVQNTAVAATATAATGPKAIAQARRVFIAETRDDAHLDGKAGCALLTPSALRFTDPCVAHLDHSGLQANLAAVVAQIRRAPVVISGDTAKIGTMVAPNAELDWMGGRWLISLWELPGR